MTADLALQQAGQAEAEIMAGNWRGPLHGIPIGLKDLLDTAGMRTTAASNHFRDRVPAKDAVLVRQLKHAGAVLVGKLNLHEFAFGGSGIVSAFGPAKNPWDTTASPAARRRVRPLRSLPASASPPSAPILRARCAVRQRCAASWGIAPARGCSVREGIIPLARSFDTAGPMARTVLDAATLLAGPNGTATPHQTALLDDGVAA